MGTLTDNLLKLTEFPFSYSFIGLLALIFGEGLNLDEPSLGELGPLLILMGFIATTLSITDPIGRFQALILLRSNFENKLSAMFPFSSPTLTLGGAREIWQVKIFGLGIMQSIPSTIVLIAASSNFRSWLKHYSKSKDAILDKLSEQLERARVEELSNIPLLGVKTLSTAWIVREIDKINAMVYFMIVVLTFLSAFTLDQFIHFGFTEKVLGSFHNSAGARISIIIFTIIGLTAVWNMIRRHFEVLRFNAFKTFRYLIVKEAYVKLRVELKIETETIEKGLLQVEQYLNNGEWTLADFALDQVI